MSQVRIKITNNYSRKQVDRDLPLIGMKKFKTFALRLSTKIFLLFFFPLVSLAQITGTGPGCPPGKLCNPLRGVDSLDQLIVKILDVVVKLGAYVAVLAVIWVGFLFVKAQGNQTELTKAKQAFLYTMIGVAILLGATALGKALEATIRNVVG